MNPKYVTVGVSLTLLMMMMLVGFASSDLDKDREECSDQLVGLATCLPYVGGDAKSPTLDCCSGLKQVLQKSRKCLCVLVKDRNDPNLGLKINATLALGLPDACHAPSNLSDCPALLHLAPNSPDAKVFEDFAHNTKGITNAPATNVEGNPNRNVGSSAEIKNDGRRGKSWLGAETAWEVLITVMFHVLYN